MARIGNEKPQTLIAISDKTLKATCLGFHVFLLNATRTAILIPKLLGLIADFT